MTPHTPRQTITMTIELMPMVTTHQDWRFRVLVWLAHRLRVPLRVGAQTSAGDAVILAASDSAAAGLIASCLTVTRLPSHGAGRRHSASADAILQ